MQKTISEAAVQNPIFFGTQSKEVSAGEPKNFRWTKEEYHYLAELGLFEGRHTKFLDGEIIEMPTRNSPHATGLTLIDAVLREGFPKNFVFRNQMPLDLGTNYEAVPDVAIVKGKTRDFSEAHPQTADLVVEVSDTSLVYDRGKKASLYARAGIEDYWILNVKDKRLEIYRRPIKDEMAFFGFSYGEIQIFGEDDKAAPLAAPDVLIKIADVLP